MNQRFMIGVIEAKLLAVHIFSLEICSQLPWMTMKNTHLITSIHVPGTPWIIGFISVDVLMH